MLDFLYHFFNYGISGCYFVIFFLIFKGLLKERAFGRNLLGTATSGIFLTCAFGHFAHALVSHAAGSIWEVAILVIIDGWTLLPAITYLILRRRFGFLIKGPDVLENYRSQLAEKNTELDKMREFEELKDNFLAMASHELRTPMTTIKGYSQILQTKLATNSDPKTKLAIQTINNQVDRMNNLIITLLEVSRIQGGRLELKTSVLDFSKCVSDTISALQITLSSHTFNFSVPTVPVLIHADQFRIEQVITNLLTNAVKYSPEANIVDIILRISDNNAVLQVCDYGSGIAPAELPKIFERFYRSDSAKFSSKEGLGLGLYISNEIIKGSGGKLLAESELGKGSKFTVILPLASTLAADSSYDSFSDNAAKSAGVSTSS